MAGRTERTATMGRDRETFVSGFGVVMTMIGAAVGLRFAPALILPPREGFKAASFVRCLTSAKFGQGLISPKLWFPITKSS
jgi:hypothetical protein